MTGSIDERIRWVLPEYRCCCGAQPAYAALCARDRRRDAHLLRARSRRFPAIAGLAWLACRLHRADRTGQPRRDRAGPCRQYGSPWRSPAKACRGPTFDPPAGPDDLRRRRVLPGARRRQRRRLPEQGDRCAARECTPPFDLCAALQGRRPNAVRAPARRSAPEPTRLTLTVLEGRASAAQKSGLS